MSIFQTPGGMNQFPKTNPISFGFIVIITVIFFIQRALMPMGVDLRILGAINLVDILRDGEYYRLITAIFLHSDFLHWLFNAFFGLYIIGASLERLIGSKKYFWTLLLSGIGASVIVLGWEFVSYTVFNNNTVLIRKTLGASGAIFGAIGYLWYLTMAKQAWFMMQDISSIRGLILINVIFSFFGGISLSGHLGGLISGLIIGVIFTKYAPHKGKKKGFGDPYDPYEHEARKIEDFDDIDVFGDRDDDDDDDDRRIW